MLLPRSLAHLHARAQPMLTIGLVALCATLAAGADAMDTSEFVRARRAHTHTHTRAREALSALVRGSIGGAACVACRAAAGASASVLSCQTNFASCVGGVCVEPRARHRRRPLAALSATAPRGCAERDGASRSSACDARGAVHWSRAVCASRRVSCTAVGARRRGGKGGRHRLGVQSRRRDCGVVANDDTRRCVGLGCAINVVVFVDSEAIIKNFFQNAR